MNAPPPLGNVARARELLTELAACGVRDVCVCAGARNAPFVAALEKVDGLAALSFFEERSAAFFALGRARRDERPVAVVVTSGTAAAELLPAAIEAHYSGAPLVFVTADRPRRMRGTGAPQTIDQVGLFKGYVELERDLEAGESARLGEWTRQGPLHLNVCFDEPILDEKLERWSIAGVRDRPDAARLAASLAAGAPIATIAASLARARHPLVLVSGLDFAPERAAIKRLLLKLGAPIYAEGASGLREDPDLAPLLLRAGDQLLPWAMKRGLFDCVLRVGGVPTARLWRDLEMPSCAIPVVSLGRLPFKGLSRGEHAWGDAVALADDLAASIEPRPAPAALLERDATGARELERALAEHPRSEPGLVRALSRALSAEASLYVGNSLPIREWDLAAERARPRWARASRGANGIDGQISTFLGGAGGTGDAWALVGDLTALYDLAAPWAAPYAPSSGARIAIINNGGGKIFSRIFGGALYENRHQLRFDHFAKAWGLGYERWSEIPAHVSRSAGLELIEILPEQAETDAFWARHDAFWKNG